MRFRDAPQAAEDWTQVATFSKFIGNALFADKENVPKCIPPTWKKDNDIRTNKKFKKSLESIESFYKKLAMFKPFFRKRVNYECHYAKKIKENLQKEFSPNHKNPPPAAHAKGGKGPAPSGPPKGGNTPPAKGGKAPAPAPHPAKKPAPAHKKAPPKKKSGGWFSSAVNWVKKKATQGVNAVKSAFSHAKNKVKAHVNKAKNAASNAAKSVAKKAGGLFGGIKNAFNKGKAALKKGASSIANKVKSGVNKLKDHAKKGAAHLKNLAKKGLNAAKNIAGKVKDAISHKKSKKVSEKEIKDKLSVADGKVFEFLKHNFKEFKDGITTFFESPVFNQIISLLNCLGKLNPNETLKKTIIGLANTMKELNKKDFISIAIDFFCQWNQLKVVVDNIKHGLDPKNINGQWKFFAEAIAKLINILKV